MKPLLFQTFNAEAAILPRRIVKMGAADGQVLQGAAATDALIGVADFIGQATVGGRVDVVLAGTVEVELGGTVTRGAPITSDASGRGVAAAPAAGTNNGIIGRALMSGVSGDVILVILNQVTFQG
jgi:hypothetical protein